MILRLLTALGLLGAPVDAAAPDADPDEQLEIASASEIEIRMQKHVNFFLRIKDPIMRQQYHKFNSHNQTLFSVFLLNIFILFFSTTFFGLLVSDYSNNYSIEEKANWGVTVTYLIAINLVSWGAYGLQRAIVSLHNGNVPYQSRKTLQRIQMCAYLALNILVCYRHISRQVHGDCSMLNDIAANWECNVLGKTHAITAETSIIIMLTPIMYAISVRGANFEFSLLLWCMTMATLVFSVCYGAEMNSILFVAYYCIGSVVVLTEARRQNYFLFFTHQKLQEFLKEREKAADDANAQEMRHMIANVAHDLKTPLCSFLNGVDFVSQVLVDMKMAGCRYAVPIQNEWGEWIRGIGDCIDNMRNTNAFMLMTINRSIDYTKASKGVKLVPHQETIHLLEALNLPLKCMKDIQTRIDLRLEAPSHDLSAHIITDKQWLQENLLCLLSNAVKYSSDGAVTICVRKVCAKIHQKMVMERQHSPGPSSDIVHNRHEGIAHISSLSLLDKLAEEEEEKIANNTVPEQSISRTASGGLLAHEYLRVEVEDHGIGLSVEAMASLFSPFKQAQRLAGGTGLGLFSLAKRVEALGGLYGVQRRRDGQEGSLFWFQIPYRPDDSPLPLDGLHVSFAEPVHRNPSCEPHMFPTGSGVGSIRPSDSGCSLSSLPSDADLCELSVVRARTPSPEIPPSSMPIMRAMSFGAIDPMDVLVVDDAPAIVKMTTMMLKRHGHTVFSASNGAEAIKQMCDRVSKTGEPFDVILMDLQMPVMDGLEATKRLRAMESTGHWYVSSQSTDTEDDPHDVERTSILLESKVASLSFTLAPEETPLRNVIIGVSANSDVETANEAYRAGVDSFIAKPFTVDAFYRIYRQIISKTAGI